MLKEATNKETTPERFREIAFQSDEIDLVIARNPKAPQNVLKQLAQSSNIQIRKAVASNANTPIEVLLELGAVFPRELLANPVFNLILLTNPYLLRDMPRATLLSFLKLPDIKESYVYFALNHCRAKDVLLSVIFNQINAWNGWREKNPQIEIEVDLSEANLESVDLAGANLQGIDLVGANLKGANLAGANLKGVNLKVVDLRWANLSGANLSDANLSGANLQNAQIHNDTIIDNKWLLIWEISTRNVANRNLCAANLQLAYLEEAYLEGANLTKGNLAGAYLAGVNLKGANLSGANMNLAYLVGANLQGANLQGANLQKTILEKADLSGADLSDANLEKANLEEVNLSGANLEKANLKQADLNSATLKWANLRGANLAKANLSRVNLEWACLEGACLTKTKLFKTNLRGANLADTVIIVLLKAISSLHSSIYTHAARSILQTMGLSRLQIGVLAQKWQPVFSKTPSIYIILEQISLSNKMVTLVKIMDITQVNYTIAKNVVNNLPALLPIVVEDKQIAQAIKTKLENLGATVSLKENHVRRSSQ